MHYEIVKSEELSFFEKRYVVINKKTNQIIDNCRKVGFLSPESAKKRVRKSISLGKLKGITENDIEIIVSDKLSGIRPVYIIVDSDSNTVIDNNLGFGWTDLKYAKSNLMRYIAYGSDFKPYEYLKSLDRDLYNFEIQYLSMNRISLYKGIINIIRKNASLEYDELKNKAYEYAQKRHKLKKADNELFLRLFDFCYNEQSENNEAKSTEDFDFGTANPEQRDAITTTEGPLLIIAGPGTGKTFTLVKRIVYIIKEKGVKPEEILVSTYTNKAANELITRVTNELMDMGISVNVKDMYIGTIHSICLRLLDEFIEFTNLDRHYGQMDETAQIYMMSCWWNWNKFLKIENFEKYFDYTNVRSLVKCINKFEEECVDIEPMLKSNDPYEVCLGKAILVHRQILKENNKVTFTTMQTELLNLLRNHPEILRKVQSRIKYFLIDEYQDANHLQEKILLMLAGEKNNICVVGDDDQGLYRFRGASVGNIINFKNNFAKDECREIVLEYNYRSNKQIIEFYNKWMNLDSLIDWQEYRLKKEIKPAKPATDDYASLKRHISTSVIKCVGENVSEWESRVCDLITKLKNSGKITDYNQIAYLSKSVSSDKTKNLIKALESHGISVYAPRANYFFDRDEIKQLLGCLLLAFPEYLDDIKHSYFTSDCTEAANECILKYPDTLGKWIKKMQLAQCGSLKTGKSITDIAYELLEFEPFRSYLEVTPTDGILAERKVRNISQIFKLISQYQELSSKGSVVLTESNIKSKFGFLFNSYLIKYIGAVSEYEDEKEYAPSGCVSFMTIHQSKGMGFPVVIVDISENIPQQFNAKAEDEILHKYSEYTEYEPQIFVNKFDYWRKYYTAFSRAQNLLILTAETDTKDICREMCNDIPSYESFDFSSLDYAAVKSANIKNRYSFTSDISVYDSCPLRYKFFRIYDFPQAPKRETVLGTVVHDAIEHINKQVLDDKLENTKDRAYIFDWIGNDYERLAQQEHFNVDERIHKTAYGHVMNYINRCGKSFDIIIDAETEVSSVNKDYILEGKIDMVYKCGNDLGIIDFKSGKKPVDLNDAQVRNYRRQLEVYSYLLEKKTGKKVRKISLYYTGTSKDEGSPVIAFDMTESSVHKTITGFDDTVKKIMNSEFNRGAENKELCKKCEFRFYCKNRKDDIMPDLEKISIDLDEEAKYLADKTNRTIDEANLYLDAEYEYMEQIGLACQIEENSENNLEEQQSDTSIVIDDDEMLNYISEKTGLPIFLVNEFYEAEYDYFKKVGIVNE